ncbi:hypothetical protein NMG60_11018622 [Bertholletia excelsa]
MRSLPLGISATPPTTATSINVLSLNPNSTSVAHSKAHKLAFTSNRPSSGLLCRASQVVELFPTFSPEIMVREARLEDCWEVAETHCSSFFPLFSFPYNFLLRMNRAGCRRTCLVAVVGSSVGDAFFFRNGDFKVGEFDKWHVTGILTLDTLAEFLPRRGPLRERRTGIAYISNLAVQERFRRKGIAKRLIAKAEAQAEAGAAGFRCIKVPEGANWPQPKTSSDIQYNFMMKLLNTPSTPW